MVDYTSIGDVKNKIPSYSRSDQTVTISGSREGHHVRADFLVHEAKLFTSMGTTYGGGDQVGRSIFFPPTMT